MLYSIYTLSNPVTGEIFYVGCTKNLSCRARQHKYTIVKERSKKKDKLLNKDYYILQLMQDPIIHIIEDLIADGSTALMRENIWISLMKENGFPLVNEVKTNVETLDEYSMSEVLRVAFSMREIFPKQVAA